MDKVVYTRVIQRAVQILGGVEPLAAYLSVSPSHVRLWADGLGTPPQDVFLRAVDLVQDHDGLPGQGPHPPRSPLRR